MNLRKKLTEDFDYYQKHKADHMGLVNVNNYVAAYISHLGVWLDKQEELKPKCEDCFNSAFNTVSKKNHCMYCDETSSHFVPFEKSCKNCSNRDIVCHLCDEFSHFKPIAPLNEKVEKPFVSSVGSTQEVRY